MLSARFAYNGRPALPLTRIQREMVARVASKLADGRYRLETAPCCVCGHADMEPLAEKDRYGLPSPMAACRTCGLLQAPERLDARSSAEFYSTEYRSLYVGRREAGEEYFAKHYAIGQRIGRAVAPFLGGVPRRPVVLEVGCGSGGLLASFRDGGCRVCGVDLDEDAIEYGRSRHGLDLRAGTVRELEMDRPPDLVIYADCLEHMADPVAEMRAVAPLLEGGLLFVSVPGVMRLAITHFSDFLLLLQNAHVHNFTARSLRNVLSVAGYEPVHIDEKVRGVFRLRPAGSPGDWESDYDRVTAHLRRMEAACRLIPLRGYLKVLGRRLFSRVPYLQRLV